LAIRPSAYARSLRRHRADDDYHGYYYRVLEGQGPQAQGGAYAYVANGRMIGGFALIAFPAQYGVSGVTTFDLIAFFWTGDRIIASPGRRPAPRLRPSPPLHEPPPPPENPRLAPRLCRLWAPRLLAALTSRPLPTP
jgi:hypothetical protein